MQVDVWQINADPTQVVAATQDALQSLGYRVTTNPDGFSGRAEVGSAVARALVGALVKRHKVDFTIVSGPSGPELLLTPAMKGWSGGAVGLARSNKDHAKAVAAVDQHLQMNALAVNHQVRVA